jgi:predicted RND superfamily exporter protein
VSLIHHVVAWSHRRRWVVFALSLLLVVVSGLGLSRLRLDADVINLLPRQGRAISPFRTYLQQFGSLDQLLVVFTAGKGHAIGDYAGEIDSRVAALRAAPEIEWVDAGTAGPDRDWAWLGNHQLLLLRGKALETALSRLQPDGMARALESSRQLLAVPSEQVQRLVSQDPLDWFGLLRQQLGGARAGVSLGLTDAGYVSADGRRRLIIAKPKRPPFDTTFSRQLLERLHTIDREAAAAHLNTPAAQPQPDEDATLPPMTTAYAGGHIISLETEALVRRESVWNSVGSLALILPLLLLVFRSVWLFSAGALPSMASLLIVLGLLGFTGVKLSAAATGSAAMLLGLGVDGVVLLYVAPRLALAEGRTGADAISAIASPSASMFYGMLTTAATFYGLLFVDFPSLQQLGLLIGSSMVACGILTLVLVPALLPDRARGSARRGLLEWPRFASWVARRRRVLLSIAGLLTIALGAAATHLQVNATLERLKSTTPAAKFEEQVQRDFGLPSDVFIVLQQGPDLEPLLADNERLLAELKGAAPALGVDGGSSLLPSNAAQERARQIIQHDAPSPDRAADLLRHEARDAGFAGGSLQPFVDRLPSLLDPEAHLAYADFDRHRLGDLIRRFIVRSPEGWTLASYAFPADAAQRHALQRTVGAHPGVQLTGLTLVNEELAERFLPQFARGLAIGSIVVVALILLMFRDWRLSVLSMLPTVVGLVWAGGLLALFGVSLDLFAVFAVVTFVGIGIDYGIHVVHRYQATGDAQEAVSHLAPVIVVAGLITLFGYGTLTSSSYPPLRSMGIVSIVSVTTLVAASLLMLPALLPTRRAPQSYV